MFLILEIVLLEFGLYEKKNKYCLLYTSDAADDRFLV